MNNILRAILILSFLLNATLSAKILGIFHFPSYSHFIIGEKLFKELARQGHEVTMISPYAQKTPVKNYRDIELTEVLNGFKDKEKKLDLLNFRNIPWIVKAFSLSSMAYSVTEQAFANKDLQRLTESKEKFDLIIQEVFLNEAFYGFAHKFNAPVILLATSGPSSWVNRITANPSPASYIPELGLPYSPDMTFLQRLNNAASGIITDIVFHLLAIPQNNALMHKYFPTAPDINDLIYNTSFILLNSNIAQSSPVPMTPNMKEIGGLHITEDTNLPEDIKTFLDNSKEGVIYFALGSNFRSSSLPKETLTAILDGFKKWNKPVLWKFEDESLPGKPDNVKIAKWLPQLAVLAHPNVKAFISHGGKLSVMESVYFGVPIVGIPIFAEQPYNVQQAVFSGYGIMLDFSDITADNLYKSIVEITSNPKYSQEAKTRSLAMRSTKTTPMEEAIYWIEYVLKFKGAPHLRSHGVNLPWYQKCMLDIILFIGAIVLGFLWLVTWSCKKICKKRCDKQVSKRKTKTH